MNIMNIMNIEKNDFYQKAAEIVLNKYEKTGIPKKFEYFYNIYIPNKLGKRKAHFSLEDLEDDDLKDEIEDDKMII